MDDFDLNFPRFVKLSFAHLLALRDVLVRADCVSVRLVLGPVLLAALPLPLQVALPPLDRAALLLAVGDAFLNVGGVALFPEGG